MRFSLREFICLTAATSFALVAFYFANDLVKEGLQTLTLIAIAAAALNAMFGSGLTRAMALGFLTPLLLCHAKILDPGLGWSLWSLLEPVVEYVQTHRDEMIEDDGDTAWLPRTHNAQDVAHGFWRLLLGYAGAKYAAYLYTRRREHGHEESDNPREP